MKKVCVINLMRLGDLIQTIPLLYSIKRDFPESTLDLVLIKPFASVIDIMPYVDNFHVIDYEIISKILSDKATVTSYVYKYLSHFIKSLKRENYDLLINVTPTNSALLLTRLITAQKIEGTYFDDSGYKVITNPWVHYFYITNLSRSLNSINLVDMFIKTARMRIYPPRAYLNGKCGSDENSPYFCVHLGASTRRRALEPEILAKAAALISKETGLKVYILGVSSEADLAERFVRVFGEGCTNLVGKTNVRDLTEIIGSSAFLLCHDTGPMHIAWACGKRVLSIFISTANPFETGPYGTGHYVLQPTLPCYPCDHGVKCHTLECKKSLRPEPISRAALSLLLRDESLLGHQEGLRVMKTIGGIDGMAELVPLTPLPYSKGLFAMLCWRSILPPILDSRVNVEQILQNLDHRTRLFFERDLEGLSSDTGKEASIIAEALGITESGLQILNRVLKGLSTTPKDYGRLSCLVGELDEVEKTLERWAYINKHWEFPVSMLKLSLKTFASHQDAEGSAQKTLYYYKLVHEQFRILYEMLSNL
ncbi:MAG: glycosyltransferase family 9 protein [Desulfatiglandales bacterium]